MRTQKDAFPELDRVKKFFPLGVENPQLLTKVQIDRYNDQGYFFPCDIFNAKEIAEIRAYFLDRGGRKERTSRIVTGLPPHDV